MEKLVESIVALVVLASLFSFAFSVMLSPITGTKPDPWMITRPLSRWCIRTVRALLRSIFRAVRQLIRRYLFRR